MAILIDKKVFTLDEIRRECVSRKILFPESVFRAANEIIKKLNAERERALDEQYESAPGVDEY